MWKTDITQKAYQAGHSKGALYVSSPWGWISDCHPMIGTDVLTDDKKKVKIIS